MNHNYKKKQSRKKKTGGDPRLITQSINPVPRINRLPTKTNVTQPTIENQGKMDNNVDVNLSDKLVDIYKDEIFTKISVEHIFDTLLKHYSA